MVTPPKDVLKDYLQGARDVLLWKLEVLSEHDLRLPRTPTGELVPQVAPDPLAGWNATESETAGIVDLYRRVQAFADETIDSLPLDPIGHVAHWGGGP
jgi:hypothetical protein